MDELENKVAVITGAASGIGRGMAEAFADAGMRIVLSDVEEAALHTTTAELRDNGADVHAVTADVSQAGDVAALAEATIKQYGAVHVLCNNAGVLAGARPSWHSTLDDWSWIIGVNLMGVVHGIHTFLPIMIDQDEEAHIVNTTSAAGIMAGTSPYAVTKSAVVALSETVYFELTQGGFKPQISVLCPGLVRTNLVGSDRNRPLDRYPDAAPIPAVSKEAMEKAFDRMGIEPRAVGDLVVDAIRWDRFYILTHQDQIGLIEHRAAQIVSGENPTMPAPPG